jgi:hypothetical protein
VLLRIVSMISEFPLFRLGDAVVKGAFDRRPMASLFLPQ